MDQQSTSKPPFLNGIQVASLVVESKPYPIFKGVNTIGRNKAAVVNIKHLTVSQHQAVIVAIDETQVYISDMNSSNGTFINNSKMIPLQLYKLTNKAEIKFGELNASFSNILVVDPTQNDALEASQLSQTQTFYSSSTQVLFNPTDISSTCVNNDQTISDNNIHEIATQIEFHPPPIPKPKKHQFKKGVHNQENQLVKDQENHMVQIPGKEVAKNELSERVQNEIIENGDDIHDLPTQVYNFVLDSNKEEQNIHEMATQVFNPSINIHEVATQVFNPSIQPEDNPVEQLVIDNEKSEEIDSTSDPNTQIMTQEEMEAISKKLNNTNDPVSLVTPTDTQDLINSRQESNLKDQEDIPVDKIKTKFASKTIHDSQEPSTSGMQNNFKEYDDSFTNSINSSKAGDFSIEETFLDNLENNDSMDFLIANTENPDSQYNLQPTSQLLNTKISQNELEEHISVHKSPEGDLEVNCKDTHKVLEQGGQGKDDISDSDTDCEDALLANMSLRLSANNSHDGTDPQIKSKRDFDDLDDSDCIPATQDAFAKELDYKPLKSSQASNLQSSEESFKLGLTELMEFPELDDLDNSKKSQSQEKKSSLDTQGVEECANIDGAPKPDKNMINDANQKELDSSDAYIEATQKIDNVFLALTQLLPSNELSERKKNTKQDIYSQSTQKLDDDVYIQPTQQIDDVFLQPTQPLSSKKVVDKKKPTQEDIYSQATQKLDEDLYIEPTQQIDDVFLQPTQPVASNKVVDRKEPNKEAIYSQATQKLDEDVFLEPTQQIDDTFLQPTQLLPLCEPIDRKKPTEGDLYSQPTQTLDEDVFVQPFNVRKQRRSKNVITDSEDMFLVPTQILDVEDKPEKSKSCKGNESFKTTSNTSLKLDEDPYIQATQPIEELATPNKSRSKIGDAYMKQSDINNDITESQLEMENYGMVEPNISIRRDRPGNPILCELEPKNFNDKDDSDDDDTCIESMSQIEAFIGSSRVVPPDNIKKETISTKTKCNTSLNNSIETLSQIEAFIKKPLPPRQSDRGYQTTKNKTGIANSKENEDRPETLSQITSFIAKPQSTKIKEEKRVSDMNSSKNITQNRISSINGELLLNSTLNERNQDESNKTNISRGLLSDVDQSFALLESKSSRIKRKPIMDPVFEDIKVNVTLHRRSMQVEENKDDTLIVPTKKSRTGNNRNTLRFSEFELPTTKSRSRRPKVPSPSSETKADTKSSNKGTKTKVSSTKTSSKDDDYLPKANKVQKDAEEDKKSPEKRRRTTRTAAAKNTKKSSTESGDSKPSRSKEPTLSTETKPATSEDVKSTEKRAPKTRGRTKTKEIESTAPKSKRQK
ncbi:unnamed protein product [Diabrotica balteata]|uniref:FHA domain-containing protein n=1 Tax=Diabrotica balteata TaxID=107213 RepID=A0A9N9XDC2_DIABA|nr:unnamed protein product [Diabrotica balteata]